MKASSFIACTLLLFVALVTQAQSISKDPIFINQATLSSTKGHNDTILSLNNITEYPSYKGGDDAMIRFLQKNIRYTQEALDAKVSGKVFLELLIEKDGSISEISVKRSLGYGLDEVAVRAIHAMPKWKPGKFNDEPVRTRLNIPISFNF